MTCCDEAACRRKQPLRIARGELSGHWFLVTKHRPVGAPNYESLQRHDVTHEVQSAVIVAVLSKCVELGAPRAIIDIVAAHYDLHPKGGGAP